MSRISFENFGARARADLSYSEKAGRHGFQQAAEARMADDVAAKMRLGPDDTLLEIGCGTGNLLLPIASRVARATGIDHPDCIASLRSRPGAERLELLEGNFLDLSIGRRYSRVLVYSVIHYLGSLDEAKAFLSRAAGMLAPGGLLMVGDIPNEDRRRRFLDTPEGKRVAEEHARLRAQSGAPSPAGLAPDPHLVRLDDAAVAALCRHLEAEGLVPRVVPQPPDLPFGHTREDLLAEKP